MVEQLKFTTLIIQKAGFPVEPVAALERFIREQGKMPPLPNE
jgi:hypothetical protein